MRRLIIAGLVYLTGIAVILVIKPQFMFREDGRWKEFGIGRDPAHFTHMPFWLFTILWAIVSYVTVSFLENAMNTNSSEAPMPLRNRGRNRRLPPPLPLQPLPLQTVPTQELTPGYYMLNEAATGRDGVPRYVYLGPSPDEAT
jgi:hypothetical protein